MFHRLGIASCLLLLAGCSASSRVAGTGGGTGSGPVPAEPYLYNYTAFDAGGSAVVAGEMDLTWSAGSGGSVVVSGTWSTRRVGGTGDVGPQVGAGHVVGSLGLAGKLTLDLNPGWGDNNVILNANADSLGSDLQGSWLLETFVGPIPGGTFSLLRRVEPAGR